MAQPKVAVITGASQGIGAALLVAYRERGYRVVATSRAIKPSADPDVLTIAGDVGDPRTAERVVREGLARFGRIDTLVNNAGIFVAKPFADYTQADYDAVLNANVSGFFHMTQRVLAPMVAQRNGHIVSLTTTLAEYANAAEPCALASLSKGGVNAATKSLAIEFAARGVRVNAVSPGVVKTPMHPADSYAGLAKLHPLGRMGEIKDIVDAILYLETASFVTGEILHVDGGQSAGH